jgi:hypothetical protein
MILRSVGMWFGLHGVLAMVGGVVWLAWRPALALVLIGSGLTALDTRRRNEFLFLSNCGVPTWSVGLLCAFPFAVLEALLHLGRVVWTTY